MFCECECVGGSQWIERCTTWVKQLACVCVCVLSVRMHQHTLCMFMCAWMKNPLIYRDLVSVAHNGVLIRVTCNTLEINFQLNNNCIHHSITIVFAMLWWHLAVMQCIMINMVLFHKKVTNGEKDRKGKEGSNGEWGRGRLVNVNPSPSLPSGDSSCLVHWHHLYCQVHPPDRPAAHAEALSLLPSAVLYFQLLHI